MSDMEDATQHQTYTTHTHLFLGWHDGFAHNVSTAAPGPHDVLCVLFAYATATMEHARKLLVKVRRTHKVMRTRAREYRTQVILYTMYGVRFWKVRRCVYCGSVR